MWDAIASIPFSASDQAYVEFNVMFVACGNAAGEANKTLPELLPTDKMNFDRTDHAGLAAVLMHAKWSNKFGVNEYIDRA